MQIIISSYIMLSLKHIMITSGISLIFGIYSICNLFLYINNLTELTNKQKNKFDSVIQKIKDENNKNFKKINMDYLKLKKHISILNEKIELLQKTDDTLNNIEDNNIEDNNNIKPSEIICDTLCDMNNVPRVKMDTMNNIVPIPITIPITIPNRKLYEIPLFKDDDDIHAIKDVFDYNYITNEMNMQEIISNKTSRSNSLIDSDCKSVTYPEIKWLDMTKKLFMFG